MSAAAVGFGNVGMQMSFSGGNSGSVIESSINRLQREKDEYEKQKSYYDSTELDEKINDLDNRINNLKTRLERQKQDADNGECKTCESRKYQDGSNDPGVSFKTAQKVGPQGAEAAVRSHENEHVNRNQAKAAREGDEIVYQTVIIKHAICPECGRVYASGGETRTVTRHAVDNSSKFDVGLEKNGSKKGVRLNTAA